MELILIRHGRPIRVENEDGAPADPELSTLGHRQASTLAAWLAEEKIDVLLASPLQRAHQTAIPLAERLGLEILLEPGVVEFDSQANVYIPLEELKETDYERYRLLLQEGFDVQMLTEFKRGVVETLERVVAEHAGKTVAVACHGGVINAWAGHVTGVDAPMFFNPDYTSVNRFLASSGGVRSLVSLNETAHLRELL